ncbi:MAG: hypothetical protein JNL01_10690 [Bdellovibrionales bacterium]|nr:hypothetical protein [Bdellovibrionales bacterium]
MKTLFKVLVGLLLVLVVGGVAGYGYMGGFNTIEVSHAGFQPMEIIFSTHLGPYRNLSSSWDQFRKQHQDSGLAECDAVGIYLDPPGTPEEKLRSIIGCRVDGLAPELKSALKAKFKSFMIPQSPALMAKFPYKNPISFFIGPSKVYPAMRPMIETEAQKTGLPAVAYEIYGMGSRVTEITYALPLGVARSVFQPLEAAF